MSGPSATIFQVVTDAHCGSSAVGHGASRKLTHLAAPTLQNILEVGATQFNPSFRLDLGDLIEHNPGSNPAESARIDTENFRRALGIFSRHDIPTHHCIGNHPLMSATEAMLLKELHRAAPYYSFDIGDHHIVMLHSRFTHPQTTPEHQSGSGIYIDEDQIRWLTRDLQTTEKPTVVCCHHPLCDYDLTGNVWFEGYPQCALTENRFELQQIFAESEKVVAVIGGHIHVNDLMMDRFGTPHIALQSLSENFRDDGTPAGTFGIGTLRGRSFNFEIYGRDLTLRNGLGSPNEIAQSLAQTYSSIADVYARKTAEYGAPECEQFDKIMQMLPASHSGVVVDFGCGQGRDVAHYQRRGFRVIGVDAAEGLIRIAERLNPEARFLVSDFADAAIEPNSAAIAIHNSSLQHVPKSELPRVLRKAFEVLEPGGILYCHYRSGQGESLSISTEYDRPIARYMALYTQAEMEAAGTDAGFEVLRSDTFDHQYSGLKGITVKWKSRTWFRKPGCPS
jgi:SAM-dependent methyltransferase